MHICFFSLYFVSILNINTLLRNGSLDLYIFLYLYMKIIGSNYWFYSLFHINQLYNYTSARPFWITEWNAYISPYILISSYLSAILFIMQQFVWNDFTEEYIATDRKHTYYPSVITNDRLYEIKISDLPVIPYFPVNSYYEWTDFRFYGLRSATAYILVFDLSNLETFQYIRTLRDQIFESRNMTNVPLLVVGNKQDLLLPAETSDVKGQLSLATTSDEKRRDIANLVKKHWKCGYVECSAKYNWKIVSVFKELMNMIDSIEVKEQSPMLDNIQEALDRNKCMILWGLSKIISNRLWNAI